MKALSDFREGQKVSLRIFARTRIGFIATIDNCDRGMLYQNEIFQPLSIGQEIDGFIRKIRDDQKIDLCLQKPGYKSIEILSQKIINKLHQHNGFYPVTDKSQPKDIAILFGVSKKSFKKAIGNLYKKRQISLEKNGIRLREDAYPKSKKQQESYTRASIQKQKARVSNLYRNS